MFKARKRLVTLVIATVVAIGAGVAASGIGGPANDDATTEAARTSEIQQPVPESLLPPVAAGGGSYRM